ncbi:DUF397 domain-containing protein [Spirillospora sp. NPDC127200]
MDQSLPSTPLPLWRKSSHSGPQGGDCVEVAAVQHLRLARDSKDPHGPVLAMQPATWTAFVVAIKRGTHDL